MKKCVASVCAAMAILVAWSPLAIGQSPSSQDDQTRLEGQEIVVDAIVLDKQKRPVAGLTASDFVIYEDGKEQKITGFRAVTGDAPTAAPRTDANEIPWTHNTVVVTDGTVQDLHMGDVRKALERYVREIQAPSDYLALFSIASGGLRLLEPSTNDKERLLKAIGDARGGFGTQREAERAAVESARSGLPDDAYSTQVVIGAEEGDRGGAGGGGGIGAASPALPPDLREIQLRLARTAILRADELRSLGTSWTIYDALLALIDAHRVLPGRRSITIFSEGFLQSKQAEPIKQAVLSAASNAGVTLYIVDARGLSVDAERGSTSVNDINRTQNQARLRGSDLGSERTSSLGGGTIFDTVSRDTTTRTDVLSEFAAATGGLFMKNSNDLFSGLRQITTDLHNYYLLYYEPSRTPTNGEYRKIEVRVRDKAELTVRARNGYYALPEEAQGLVRLDEQKLYIKALGASPANRLPVAIHPFAFGTENGGTRISYVLRIPPEGIATKQGDGKLTASYYVLVTARDDAGHVVGSDRVPLTLDLTAEQASQVRAEGLRLEGGFDVGGSEVRQVDAIVSSDGDGRIAREVKAVESLDWSSAPAVSDVVLSKIVVAASAEGEASFKQGDKYILPVADATFATTDVMNVYATIYWPKGMEIEKPVLSIWQGKQRLAMLPLEVQPATGGANGLVFTAIPVKDIPPGDYELRINVRDKSGRASMRGAKFTVR
jgi:VWFA-related protein